MEAFKRVRNLLGLVRRPKPPVGQTPSEVVYRENKWSLIHYHARLEGLAHKTPVLFVPSLINKHYVLDLLPGKSFTEYLVANGFDVFCIDWGTPTDEDRYVTFEDIVERALGRALRFVARTVPRRQAHLLGYCMGGTLAAIHGAVHPEYIASLATLAAPVRFHDGSTLSRWTNASGFDVNALVDGAGTIPWQLLQSAFHLLRPTLGLQKAVNVIDRAWNDEFLDGFLALEAWGNDNVALPGEFYRRYIQGLYQDDGLLAGRFALGGHQVKLENIRFPVMAVTFANDNIVPASSAATLINVISSTSKRHLHLPGGHVGAVVSKHAAKSLWPQLAEFYAEHDEASVGAPAVTATPPPPPKPAIMVTPQAKAKPPRVAVSRLPKPKGKGRRSGRTSARH